MKILVKKKYVFFNICSTFLYVLVIGFTALVLQSCQGTKKLGNQQFLLGKQEILGNKKIDDNELLALFQQKRNRRFLGIPIYLNAYYWGLSRYDTAKILESQQKLYFKYYTKLSELSDTSLANIIIHKSLDNFTTDSLILSKSRHKSIKKHIKKYEKKISKSNLILSKGNWWMRVVGETPSIHDTSQSIINCEYIKGYCQNNGYFDIDVQLKLDTNKKWIKETYTLEEKTAYSIEKLNLVCKDSSVAELYRANSKSSYIKIGGRYREADLTSERDRLYKLYKNSGYFDFTPQYISYDVDSSRKKKTVSIDLIIANADNGKAHPRYLLKNIYFNSDITESLSTKDTGYYRKIHFIYSKENFSKRIISKKISMREGEYFNQSKVQNTQRQLAMLDMYKFINVNFEKIKLDSNQFGLNTFIRTTPLKKFQSTEEAGVNMSSNFIPGPSGSLNFKSRNTFRGFEVFETNLRATVVGQASILNNNEFYRSEEYLFQNSLSFPQFFFPTGRKLQNYIENFSPVTRFSSSYSFVRRPEYTRDNINIGMTYNLFLSLQKQLSLSIVDVNLVATRNKAQDFEAYLESLKANGNNLLNSFGTALVSSISGAYTFTNNIMGENKRSKYFRLQLESGGTVLNLLSQSQILQNTDTLFGLKTFRYVKLATDLRYYFPIRKNTLAMRYHVGIAKAYDREEVLPYERNFFLGGSNSIRAWAPRRLGPGSWVAERDSEGRPLYRFEQPGSIMLELSMEYRFKVIKFIESALFVDAGNIWIWQPRSGVEKARPEGVFYVDKFLSQMAVGTGIGLRLNFSFLVLRFDFGLKVKDPAMPLGNRWVFLQKGYRSPLLNLSIGYPF